MTSHYTDTHTQICEALFAERSHFMRCVCVVYYSILLSASSECSRNAHREHKTRARARTNKTYSARAHNNVPIKRRVVLHSHHKPSPRSDTHRHTQKVFNPKVWLCVCVYLLFAQMLLGRLFALAHALYICVYMYVYIHTHSPRHNAELDFV